MNLNGKTFRVASTATDGVVSSETQLHCVEIGARVLGRYAGGTIIRGCLVGVRNGAVLSFRFAQREIDGRIHAGRSLCDIAMRGDGRLAIAEHFSWDTRQGSGTNVFEEVVAAA